MADTDTNATKHLESVVSGVSPEVRQTLQQILDEQGLGAVATLQSIQRHFNVGVGAALRLQVLRQAVESWLTTLPPAPPTREQRFSVDDLARLKTIDRCIAHSEQKGVKLLNTLSAKQVRFLRELVERLSAVPV